jgi:hypothetical protein
MPVVRGQKLGLIRRCSLTSFEKNLDVLFGETTKRQSFAVAYSTLRRACKEKSKKRLTPTEIVKRGKARRKRKAI